MVTLVAEVASPCGLSPQYGKLEQLQRTYVDRGFTLLGLPSDQFEQGLDSAAAVAKHC